MNNNNKSKFLLMKRRFITLIEIMIVMFLIALITGVVAYNYRGSLDEGKAFKTQAGIQKLHTFLSLAVADTPDIDLSGGHWKDVILRSPLVQNANSLIKDGWGEEYQVDTVDGIITIRSDKYEAYKQKNPGSMFKQ